MSKEMRIGERVPIDGSVGVYLSDSTESWKIEGYDVSPTAIALLVPVDHEIMNVLPKLFKRENPLDVEHELFGRETCVLHRVFRYRSVKTKWILSFLHAVRIDSD